MKKFFGVIASLGCLFGLSLAGGAWWKAAHTPRLTILHVNDTHSYLEPVRSGELTGMGGALERAAYIDSVMQADGPENVLLLHAGDFSQGTSYYSEFGAPGRPEDRCGGRPVFPEVHGIGRDMGPPGGKGHGFLRAGDRQCHPFPV